VPPRRPINRRLRFATTNEGHFLAKSTGTGYHLAIATGEANMDRAFWRYQITTMRKLVRKLNQQYRRQFGSLPADEIPDDIKRLVWLAFCEFHIPEEDRPNHTESECAALGADTYQRDCKTFPKYVREFYDKYLPEEGVIR